MIEMIIAATLSPFPLAPLLARLFPIQPKIKPSRGKKKDKINPATAIPLLAFFAGGGA